MNNFIIYKKLMQNYHVDDHTHINIIEIFLLFILLLLILSACIWKLIPVFFFCFVAAHAAQVHARILQHTYTCIYVYMYSRSICIGIHMCAHKFSWFEAVAKRSSYSQLFFSSPPHDDFIRFPRTATRIFPSLFTLIYFFRLETQVFRPSLMI